MANGLGRVLGARRGRTAYTPEPGVIGRVTKHRESTIIETGRLLAAGGWEKTPNGVGHIVLNPQERLELIVALVNQHLDDDGPADRDMPDYWGKTLADALEGVLEKVQVKARGDGGRESHWVSLPVSLFRLLTEIISRSCGGSGRE